LVEDPEIQALNRQYRGKDSPTNVLAFAMRDGDFGDLTPTLLGDVVVSMDTVLREATDAGRPLAERFTEMLVHGILHLMGFDHETSEADALFMEEKSRELLTLLRST
jgi:probable rRNA maturation factor